MYSAYDGGEHSYQLIAFLVPSDPSDSDPVVPSSAQWKVDPAFFKNSESAEPVPGGILLTTKKAGFITLEVTFKTRSGARRRSQTTIWVSQAYADEWAEGDLRYTHAPPPNSPSQAASLLKCEITGPQAVQLPQSGACADCHEANAGLSWMPTPLQVAGYKDDELIDMFSNGRAPASGYRSAFLRGLPDADCVFKAFHTLPMTADERVGLVWKLRSLEPRKRSPDAND